MLKNELFIEKKCQSLVDIGENGSISFIPMQFLA